MGTIDTSKVILDHSVGDFLAAFAEQHRIQNLEQLIALPFSALWKMDGYSLHVQNEILDLANKYDVVDTLKQY